MSGKPTLAELLEVQAHFGLPSPALVEKDWYVVKALAAVASVDASPFRIIFAGGTALVRAHKLVQIPTIKHWEITTWFKTRNADPEFGGLSPRDYLRDKDWNTRYWVGLETLRMFGVLKP